MVYNISMKIGIFGGTFSPPHITHREMAQCAVSQLKLDKLFVLPCGFPPHKSTEVSAAHRLEMAKLNFAKLPNTEIDDYEIAHEGNSYSYLTIQHYRQIYPDAELFFIIGGDSIRDFFTWRNPDEICKLTTLAVCERAEIDTSETIEKLQTLYGAKIVKVDITRTNISSTQIRVDCQFGIDSKELLPSVLEYIKQNGLYSNFYPLVEKVKSTLTEEKFQHTYYVVKRGVEYREKVPFDKAFLACLLHDCAKYIPQKDWEKYNYQNTSNLPLKIVHGELGEKVAKIDYNINDAEILDAIKYHTTARANMTPLDKIVFVADKTEASRPYPIAHLLAATLDETFVNVLSELYQRRSRYIDITQYQIDAFKQYVEEK